jgi:hypothetical protein
VVTAPATRAVPPPPAPPPTGVPPAPRAPASKTGSLPPPPPPPPGPPSQAAVDMLAKANQPVATLAVAPAPPPPPPPPPSAPIQIRPKKENAALRPESGIMLTTKDTKSHTKDNKSKNNTADRSPVRKPLTQFPAIGGEAFSYEPKLVPFVLMLRKEMFAPNEKLENPLVIDLIFQQIVSDVLGRKIRHPRVTEKENSVMRTLFESKGIIIGSKSTTTNEKIEIVERAKVHRTCLHQFDCSFQLSARTLCIPKFAWSIFLLRVT